MSFDKTLESARLVYKPINAGYCTDVYLGWLNDAQVNRYLEISKPYSKKQLEDYLLAAEGNEHLLFWAIHIRENGKHIGNIKIDPIDRYHGLGEYGIMMGDRCEWGKGYASEASKAIIEYCFKEQHLRKISLGVVEENTSAVELYKKLGFVVEGVYKKHGLYNGHYCDVLRMALFNPAYE